MNSSLYVLGAGNTCKYIVMEKYGNSKKEGEKRVWISKKKWQQLEKRLADLETQIQSQPEKTIEYINKLTRDNKQSPLIV